MLDKVFVGSEKSKAPYMMQVEQICDVLEKDPYNEELQNLLSDIEEQLGRVWLAQCRYANHQKELQEQQRKEELKPVVEILKDTNGYLNDFASQHEATYNELSKS